MSKNKQFVRFDNVDKSYDGKILVVKGLNLDIEEGEFVTMLGPSGSGKTTCLMMLAGFETPTHGEIYLDNNIISNIPPHKRGIGMVFQNYALFPHMTVNENLAFPLEVRKLNKSDIEEKILPTKHALLPAYPNPFNGIVTIPFELSSTLNTTIINSSEKQKPDNAVILCHGYGGDGNDISILANYWKK